MTREDTSGAFAMGLFIMIGGLLFIALMVGYFEPGITNSIAAICGAFLGLFLVYIGGSLMTIEEDEQ